MHGGEMGMGNAFGTARTAWAGACRVWTPLSALLYRPKDRGMLEEL